MELLKKGWKMKSGIFALWVSFISNLILTLLKLIIGLLFQSQVLIADGFHNAGDVIATLAALISSKVAKKPADDEHPYGHGKAEVIASGIVAIILAFAAVFMAYQSIAAFFLPPVEASLIALITALISLVWKQALYFYCIRLGKAQHSKSLISTAIDHLADVYATIAAIIGIGIALLGDEYNIAFAKYGDPIAGIIVSLFVMKLAYEMGKESVDILMERNISFNDLNELRKIVNEFPEVKRIDKIRGREHGHYIIVDIRISIPNELSIQEGHDLGRKIKTKIMSKNPRVEEVLIHLNPWHNE